MIEYKNVHSTMTTVPEIEINVDTVYVRSNIKRMKEQDPTSNIQYEYWQYDEVQYTYREWFQVLSDENNKLKKSQLEQDINIDATQEVVDYLLLDGGSMPMVMKVMEKGILNNKGVVNDMSMYVVIRVKKKTKISLEEGKKAYKMFLSNPEILKFKDERDLMLLADGYDEVIVEL